MEKAGESVLQRLQRLERLGSRRLQDYMQDVTMSIDGTGPYFPARSRRYGLPGTIGVSATLWGIFDLMDRDCAEFMQWMCEQLPRTQHLGGSRVHLSTICDLLVHVHTVLEDYIRARTKQLTLDLKDWEVIRRLQGANHPCPAPKRPAPEHLRFLPTDAWFVAFIKGLKDEQLLLPHGNSLGLYMEMVQVSMSSAEVRYYFHCRGAH